MRLWWEEDENLGRVKVSKFSVQGDSPHPHLPSNKMLEDEASENDCKKIRS